MIKSVVELADSFTRQEYPADPNTGFSTVPLPAIQSFIFQNFGETGFEYKVTNAGSLADGKNFVTIALSVKTTEGWTTVAGGAEGPIGVSGLIMMALRNAVLRGLGAGLDFYDNDEPFIPANNTAQPPQTYAPAPNNYATPMVAAAPTQGGYQRATSSTPYGPWTGMGKNGQPIVIKTGSLAGQAWIHLDPDTLRSMASKGNSLATLELQRRTGMGGPATTAPAYGGAGFPPNAFTNQ